MQIITNNQVEYCNLQIKSRENSECVPGISFKNKLFAKCKFYFAEQKSLALEYSKKKYLECKGAIAYVILEDITGLTVWEEDKSAIIAGQDDPLTFIQSIDLEDLASKMRSVGGIKIKDRLYYLKTYKQCFEGTEACKYFMDVLNLSVEQAIALGQRLIDEKWIHHVVDQQSFKNEKLYYRFYWDEE